MTAASPKKRVADEIPSFRWLDMERAYSFVASNSPYTISGDRGDVLGKLFWARMRFALETFPDVPSGSITLTDTTEAIDSHVRKVEQEGLKPTTLEGISIYSFNEQAFKEFATKHREAKDHSRTDQAGRLTGHGTDGYASYLPLHFMWPLKKQAKMPVWGIFMSELGIMRLAVDLYDALELSSPQDQQLAVDIAYQVLLRHELFHFKVEQWALVQELATGRPIYVPYMERVYSTTFLKDTCLEEALANASVLNSTKIDSMDRERAPRWKGEVSKVFFDKQGPGYRNYRLTRGSPYGAATSNRYRNVVNYFCNQLLYGAVELGQTPEVPFFVYPPNNNFLRAENLVPLYIVKTLLDKDSFIQTEPPTVLLFREFLAERGVKRVQDRRPNGREEWLAPNGTTLVIKSHEGHVQGASLVQALNVLGISPAAFDKWVQKRPS